jgi:AcrR family transcriptional regulator
MARRIPPHRLADLAAAAVRVFTEHGYRRTQMADVAAAMGIAKGTIYLYVESKAALFDFALRHADGPVPVLSDAALPIATPEPGELEQALRRGLVREAAPPPLLAALEHERADDVSRELEAIVRALFAISRRRRGMIRMIDRCAGDHPELSKVFYEGGRFAQLELLARYLRQRGESGQLRPVPVPEVAARFMIESVATWAVHIHWDPSPQPIDERVAEDTVVHFLLNALLPTRPL